jgi:hypothetical protein
MQLRSGKQVTTSVTTLTNDINSIKPINIINSRKRKNENNDNLQLIKKAKIECPKKEKKEKKEKKAKKTKGQKQEHECVIYPDTDVNLKLVIQCGRIRLLNYLNTINFTNDLLLTMSNIYEFLYFSDYKYNEDKAIELLLRIECQLNHITGFFNL